MCVFPAGERGTRQIQSQLVLHPLSAHPCQAKHLHHATDLRASVFPRHGWPGVIVRWAAGWLTSNVCVLVLFVADVYPAVHAYQSAGAHRGRARRDVACVHASMVKHTTHDAHNNGDETSICTSIWTFFNKKKLTSFAFSKLAAIGAT